MTQISISDLQSESKQYLNSLDKTGNELSNNSAGYALSVSKVFGGVQAGPNGEGCTERFIKPIPMVIIMPL